MIDLLRDLRFALRGFRRRPGFTATAVVTLALGLGVNAAVFAVFHAALLRPLALSEPERLVRLFQAYPERDSRFGSLSRPNFDDWAGGARSFDSMAAYGTLSAGLTLVTPEEAVELQTTFVSGDFFTTLGVEPALGRALRSDEEGRADRVVVLSHRFWQRRLGGDPEVVGRQLELDHEPYTVVGVMPESFRYPDAGTELWALLSVIPESSIPRLREVAWLEAIGRLRPGVSPEAAEAELGALARALETEHPEANAGAGGATVVPLREHLTGELRPALLALAAAVAWVLMIACANVAGMLLASGLGRRRELAVRTALGAGRWRLLRQLVGEGLLLGLAGGAFGWLLASWGLELLDHLGAGTLTTPTPIILDLSIALFTIALSVLAAVGASLLPALRASRPSVSDDLAGGAATSSPRQARLRGALVVSQVALAAMLLVGAGLLLGSLERLLAVDPGFEPEGLLAVRMTISDARYPERQQYLAFYEQLLDRLGALPGVEAVGSIRSLPFEEHGEVHRFAVAGRPAPPLGEQPTARVYQVSPGLFRAMDISLLAGRDLDDRDRAGAPPVVVINRFLAERYWPGRDAVGERLELGGEAVEVVGVVADVRHLELADAPPETIYLPQLQSPRRGMTFMLRTAGDPRLLAGPVREVVRALAPQQPLRSLAAMEDVVAASVGRPRLLASLVGIFAVLALGLAAVGLYGVIAFLVGQRRREIGLRVVLGARRGDVLRLVLSHGLRLAGLGLALGLLGAWAVGGLLQSLLFATDARDPWTFLGVAALLAAVAALASYLPGRSAARLEPAEALRLDD